MTEVQPRSDDALWGPLKKDDKVLRGRNGRLFLDNDQNAVLQQHTGELLFSPAELRTWRRLLENRIAWLERRGVPYYFLVPPNAHAVFPEDLPDAVTSGGTRPLLQLIDYLESQDSFAHVIYPLEELQAAKAQLIYPKTDPHWSGLGAFVGYRSLVREMGSTVRMNVVDATDVKWNDYMWFGELGVKVDPEQESQHVWGKVEQPEAFLVFDNRVLNNGSIVITECPQAPDATCLLFGDSFSMQLMPFLASSFRRLVFAYASTLDHEFVREHEPDVVISLLNERFLIEPPDDAGGHTLHELEQDKKQAAGDGDAGAMRPQVQFWDDAKEALGSHRP